MKKILSVPSYQYITVIIFGICFFVTSNLNWYKESWKDVIAFDGKGYYAYLPAVFIYHDLNFGFFDTIEKKNYSFHYFDYREDHNGIAINKFYTGTSVALMPFFFTAHIAAEKLGYPADGYSKPYPIAITIAAVFYLLLSCFFISGLLRLYKIPPAYISFILTALVFGTNVFYYTVSEPSISHIYSFAFTSLFLYFSKKYFDNPAGLHFIILSFALGMIVLIRPVNILIVAALPFISGSLDNLKKGLAFAFRTLRIILPAILLFTGIIFIQLMVYKKQTGNFFIYSYKEEGFDFFHPQMINMLFSYRKGLFVYTPLWFVSLSGLWFLYKENRYLAASFLGFFLLITYVLSSWWLWYYGGSFSSRVFIEYFPFFSILLAIALTRIKSNIIQRTYIGLIIILIIICQIQTWQYRYNHIHWSDMTKEKYWDVFLRIDKLI